MDTHERPLPPSAQRARTGVSHPLAAKVRESMKGTLCETMGMDILELRPDGGIMTMPIDGNRQPMGLLHGGASLALAETLVSLAAVLHGADVYGEGTPAVGTTYSATHHRPGRQGSVTAVGTARHLGSQVVTYLVDVRDENDTLLCSVLGGAQILKPRGN